MKIYRIGMYSDPTVSGILAKKAKGFAHFSAVGPWISERPACKACGWHWQDYGVPLEVQWEVSSDIIGDFSWDGPFGTLFLIKKTLVPELRAIGFDCKFHSVSFVDHRRKKNIVPYPYDGPVLVWGVCNTFLDLDMRASDVKKEIDCKECGYSRFTVRIDGITVRKRNWSGECMFRIRSNGASLVTFVTEEGRALIEQGGFTNIGFTEAGELVR